MGYNQIVHFVYIIRSIQWPTQTYVGIATNLKSRLKKHNDGANKHTSKFKPWKLIWFCAYPTKTKAATFEKYLKTASGIAFRRKRLM
jgi:putative endonuclease